MESCVHDRTLNASEILLASVKNSLDIFRETHTAEVSGLKSAIMQTNRNYDLLMQEGREDTSLLQRELKIIRADLTKLVSHLIPSSDGSAQLIQKEIDLPSGVHDIAASSQFFTQSHRDVPVTLQDTSRRPDHRHPEQPQQLIFSTPSKIFDSAHRTVVVDVVFDHLSSHRPLISYLLSWIWLDQ
jgi:hypothetical protein